MERRFEKDSYTKEELVKMCTPKGDPTDMQLLSHLMDYQKEHSLKGMTMTEVDDKYGFLE